jgi:membrane associated rhomboid family serine protease
MLYDRPYMHEQPSGRRTSPLTWLLCAVSAGFVIQMVLSRWFGLGDLVDEQFAVTIPGLMHGKVWTLLTYGFLHSPSNLLHIVCNLLAIYFLGRELLPMLGTRRFLGLYGTAIVVGALAWFAANYRFDARLFAQSHEHLPVALYGATSAVDALLIVFACFFPNQEMTFLFFFVPVRLKPKYIAGAVVIFDLFGFAFYEVMGQPSPLGFAHSAHLGGMAVGWLYYRFVHDAEWHVFARKAEIELPHWLKRSPRAAAAVAAPARRLNLTDRGHVRVEVDRILDKINSHGFGALTAEEKHLLDEARDLLSRH